jgi:hypothetical protein
VTDIVLLGAAAVLLGAALWLVLFREPRVAAWWYRLFNDPEPYAPEFADEPDSVDAVHDSYERAKYFTEEEAAQLQATAPAPVVVAGSDLILSQLIGEIYGAFNDYREGIDVCAGAPREPSPEVKR